MPGQALPTTLMAPVVLALMLAPPFALEVSAARPPLDLIVAVDTSGSMDHEMAEVQSELNQFTVLLQAKGYDLRVILIADPVELCVPAPLGSGNCPADENLPGYRHVAAAIGSTDALARIVALHAQYASSLRAGSRRVLLVVTDDESGTSASAFVAQLTAVDPDFADMQFHAIAASVDPQCFPSPNACCVDLQPIAAAEGTVYKQLVTQTSGVFYDLCTQDFTPAWARIADAVAIFVDGFEDP
jgi:hypothetical protein